ncbi:innexin inx3-like [Hydractinia symbiolongicarpus]|uniref:innexin inx3-like n=1 Tax=Hydractinia symbiolongicarpus TaxID=13093 RepID=UPI00255030A5|nr:innexin inx3-like [Hydractinia symbiolongicarpus]
MPGIVGDLKDLLSFKYKTRSDTLTDQFNRVLMVKFMLVAGFLTGLNWYSDEFECIVPSTLTGVSGTYVSQACWITGFYVYKELKETQNFLGYYGIPNNIAHNGSRISRSGELVSCVSTPGSGCNKFEKVFYLQYQWFPYYIVLLGVFFYIPYLIYLKVNEDMFSLEKAVSEADPNTDDIMHSYFVDKINTATRQKLKIILNLIVKILYLCANVLTFVFTDGVLNNDFRKYGSQWMKWTSLSNYDQYNYIGLRQFFKAGEKILPNFGLCDIMEYGQDNIYHLTNDARLICEISPNVLYQYVLGVLWIMLILGMVVSIVGIISTVFAYILRSTRFPINDASHKRVISSLSLRQQEYLDFIRKKNFACYGKLIRILAGRK